MVTAKRVDRNLDDVLKAHRAHLPELHQRYHVTTLGIFGSYLCAECKDRLGFENRVGLAPRNVAGNFRELLTATQPNRAP